MRTLLFVITLILLTACQRHYGTYATPPNYTAWGITLRKDYTFNYGYSSCSWAEAGRGEYEIIGDTLQLKFEDFKDATHGNVDLRELSPHQDSVVVDMTVIDSLTLEAIPFASILFTRAGEIISGTETNFYGQTSLSFPRAVAPVTFAVSYLGYSTFAFTITEPGQYQAEVHMAGSSRVKPIPAQTRTFRIVAWKKDSLLLSWFPEDEYDELHPTTLYRYQPK